MAKPVADVIDELIEALRRLEVSTITLSWPEFYKLNQIERFKSDRREQLIDRGTLKGIILGFGDNAVVACRDRNFAPFRA
jgi:hypothetical protein